MYIPEVIILSTQRSGTHLLQSLLASHPMIEGKGEMFLRFKRTGELMKNVSGKINVAILMYSEILVFQDLIKNEPNDLLEKLKVIHLVRNAAHVAKSRLQMAADKSVLGNEYRAHRRKDDKKIYEKIAKATDMRGYEEQFENIRIKVLMEQHRFREVIKSLSHVEINYEEMAPDNANVECLNEGVQSKLMSYLGLELKGPLVTSLIKTGIE